MDRQVAVGEHIVRIRPEQGAEVGYAGVQGEAELRARLPPPPTPTGYATRLIDREEQLRAAQGGYAPGSPIEVVGEAGIGKRSLLRALSDRHVLGGGQGRVVFVDAAGLPGEDLLQILFETFYDFDGAKVATAPEIDRHLEDRGGLVVLDDPSLPPQELDRVMKLAPRCAFAFGTQESRVSGQGRSIALHGLDETSCLELVRRELGRELSEHERGSMSRLAQALEGHPLRMVQAAHLMAEQRRPASDQPPPSGSPQEQFDELIARSVDEESKRLLGPLAAFPGLALQSRRLGDITGVPDAAQALALLGRRGLVDARATGFALVGTASSALARHIDGAPWRERTLAHYADAALSPEEAPVILRLLAEAAAAGDHANVLRLARAADEPLALGRRWGAWREALEAALSAGRDTGDRRAEAWALHQLGSRAGCLGDVGAATGLLDEALRLREQLGDEAGASLTRDNRAVLTRAESASPAPAEASPPPEPAPPAAATPPAVAAPPPQAPSAAPAPPPMAPLAAPSGPQAPQREPTPAPEPSATEQPTAAPRAYEPPGPSRSEPPAPPRRPAQTTRSREFELPPLKPILGGLAALLLVILIVVLVSGGDDDSPSGATEGDPAAESGQNQGGGRGGRRRPRRPPQKLRAAIGPKTLQFSAAVADRSRPQSVRATNRGGARIRLGKVRLRGGRAGFVITDGCSGTRLSRGQTCLVVVSFAPQRRRGADTAGTVNGALIFTNDGKGGRQTVALRANRLAR